MKYIIKINYYTFCNADRCGWISNDLLPFSAIHANFVDRSEFISSFIPQSIQASVSWQTRNTIWVTCNNITKPRHISCTPSKDKLVSCLVLHYFETVTTSSVDRQNMFYDLSPKQLLYLHWTHKYTLTRFSVSAFNEMLQQHLRTLNETCNYLV